MAIKETVLGMQEEVKELKKEQQSLAWELLQDSKKANKRIAIAFSSILIIFIMAYVVTVGLILNYINETEEVDIITNTKSQEISDIDNIENSTIINGDMYGENKAN